MNISLQNRATDTTSALVVRARLKRVARRVLGVRRQARIDAFERHTAILDELNHKLGLIGEMNHRLTYIEKRFDEIRDDAQTVLALSLSFQRFAAELTDHLVAVADDLARLAADHDSSSTR